MKNIILAGIMATGIVAAVEAAPEAAVTQSDLQALIQRITALEQQNQAQAARIAELEAATKKAELAVTEQGKKVELQTATLSKLATSREQIDEGTTTNESGRIYRTGQGFKYYLADKGAGIFDPLSKYGLKITPYGYLVFEGVYSDRPLDCDWSADFVKQMDREHNSTLSMQDSILGIQFETPESIGGWTFTGCAEFDLAGGDQNTYDFHWRHIYVNAQPAETVLDSGCKSQWSILFGQTWHLWKMVSPSEIDGAWMENTGHPYRRSPQLRVTHKWSWEDSSLEARVGIVKGGPGMGGDRDWDGVQDNTDSVWPIFETALVYDHVAPWEKEGSNKRWLIGFGGMYGRDRVADRNGNDDEYDKMMGMFAASVPFGDFTLTGQFFIGQGLGDVQAGCGQTVLFDTTSRQGHAVRTMGGFADLAYKLNEDWSFAVGYGFDNPFDDDIDNSDGTYFYNDRAYIAAFYQIVDNFKVGLEYARLMTSYYENDKNDHDYEANRVQFSAFYDF